MTHFRTASGLRTLFGLAASLVLCGAPPPAWAQEDVPARQVPTHRIGPFTIAPSVTLRDIGVDGNVYNELRPISDFTFTVAPLFSVSARIARVDWGIISATDFVYFAHQASERSANQILTVSGRMPLRRFALTGLASYFNTRQRPSQEIDARSRRVVSNGELGVSFALTPKISAALKGGYMKMAYDGDAVFDNTFLAPELNRTARSVTASLGYTPTRLTSLSVSMVRTQTRFLEVPLRDADIRDIRVGVALHPRALVGGSVNVGHQRFDPRSPLLRAFDGPVGAVDVSLRAIGRSVIGVSMSRNLEFSYYEFQPYYIRQGYGMWLRRYLGRAWDAQVLGTRYQHAYQRLTTLGGAAATSDTDRLLDLAVTAGYQAAPGTRFTISVGYGSRHSGFESRNYDSARVATSVSYAF
jgi:hypothetical protein